MLRDRGMTDMPHLRKGQIIRIEIWLRNNIGGKDLEVVEARVEQYLGNNDYVLEYCGKRYVRDMSHIAEHNT